MLLKVLGSYGSKYFGKNLVSFLIKTKKDFFLIDAGNLYSSSELFEAIECEKNIKIFLSHVHLDHIQDLPFLLDYLVNTSSHLTLYLSKKSKYYLEKYLFNNIIWPDFSKIKNKRGKYVLNYKVIREKEVIYFDNLKIIPLLAIHSIETFSFLIKSKRENLFISGDTINIKNIVDYIKYHRLKNKKNILLVDISFSSSLTKIAYLSKHYSTKKFIKDFLKYNLKSIFRKIYIYHLKPWEENKIKKELKNLKFYVSFLKEGTILELN